MVMAGATAVQVGAGLFRDIRLPEKIVEEVRSYMNKEGVANLADLVGVAR